MTQAVGTAAAAAGYLLRFLLYLLGWVPVVAGPLLVLGGTWAIYPPAACILAGLVVCWLTLQRATTAKRSVRR